MEMVAREGLGKKGVGELAENVRVNQITKKSTLDDGMKPRHDKHKVFHLHIKYHM